MKRFPSPSHRHSALGFAIFQFKLCKASCIRSTLTGLLPFPLICFVAYDFSMATQPGESDSALKNVYFNILSVFTCIITLCNTASAKRMTVWSLRSNNVSLKVRHFSTPSLCSQAPSLEWWDSRSRVHVSATLPKLVGILINRNLSPPMEPTRRVVVILLSV